LNHPPAHNVIAFVNEVMGPAIARHHERPRDETKKAHIGPATGSASVCPGDRTLDGQGVPSVAGSAVTSDDDTRAMTEVTTSFICD